MEFKSEYELDMFLSHLTVLSKSGSQGITYVDKGKNLVYKISYYYFDNELESIDFNEESVLQFKDIKSSTFIFPSDIISLNGIIIGYVMPYVNGINLWMLNPLNINLDWLELVIDDAVEAIKQISKQNVNCYDMMYNILLGKQFYFIDTDEYTLRKKNYLDLLHNNLIPFNLEVMYFLVDGLFNDIIKDDIILAELLASKGVGISVIIFTKHLRKYLKKLMKKEIITLNDASILLGDSRNETSYIRDINLLELKR